MNVKKISDLTSTSSVGNSDDFVLNQNDQTKKVAFSVIKQYVGGGNPIGILGYEDYDSSTTYNEGNFAVYQDILYVCTATTTGTWDSTKWTQTSVNDLIGDISTALDTINRRGGVV